MLSTTRRALGVLGLTGSLVASFMVSGPSSSPPEVLCTSLRFRLPARNSFGALSGRATPIPVESSTQSFHLPAAEHAGRARSDTPPVPTVMTMNEFLNHRCSDLTEETASPHPLEVLDADPTVCTTRAADVFRLSSVKANSSDSLSSIARRLNLRTELLSALNPQAQEPQNPLEEGSKIITYNGLIREHRVSHGESIWSISCRYGLPMAVPIYLNGLKSEKIHPGDILFLPAGRIAPKSLRRMKSEEWVRKLTEPIYHILLQKYGRLTSGFGWRQHPVTKRRGFHVGIDIASPKGTKIFSWKDGIVERCGPLGLLGNTVVIRHSGGMVSIYGHCSKLLVKLGQKVKKGQAVALVGRTGRATGCHLHFAIKKCNHFVNPMKYLGT